MSGVGGWNDSSGASDAARKSLQQAAGVTIPDAQFVLRVLAVYLIVLVPVNLLIFRLLGRMEWAWVAAPVIAIVGAIAVIRLAQLDIGFVRSRTEITVLEMQGGYPRAHLTRYTAFYSSLSSNYSLRFEDTSAMSRPFPPTYSPDRVWPVTYRRDRDVELSGFQVASNTTGFVHSEQMYEPGGVVHLVGDGPTNWQVANETELDLHHVGLLWRTADGRYQTCWLGDLPAKANLPLAWRPPAVRQEPWFEQWGASRDWGDVVGELMVPGQGSGGARPEADDRAHGDLAELTKLAAVGGRLMSGDVRLVGWFDGFLPGLQVTPEASQVAAQGLVLVHLRRGALPPPVRDKNIFQDVGEWGDDEEIELMPDGTNESEPFR